MNIPALFKRDISICGDAESSGLVCKSFREEVLQIEAQIEQSPQVDCPVKEYFISGMYAREITIPGGTRITGAVHKKQSIVVLSAGRMILYTESGKLDICAPFTMICNPGAKNLADAIDDCVWTNFFVTDETDPEKLVEELTESKASELIGGSENRQLLNMKKVASWLLD